MISARIFEFLLFTLNCAIAVIFFPPVIGAFWLLISLTGYGVYFYLRIRRQKLGWTQTPSQRDGSFFAKRMILPSVVALVSLATGVYFFVSRTGSLKTTLLLVITSAVILFVAMVASLYFE